MKPEHLTIAADRRAGRRSLFGLAAISATLASAGCGLMPDHQGRGGDPGFRKVTYLVDGECIIPVKVSDDETIVEGPRQPNGCERDRSWLGRQWFNFKRTVVSF